MAARGIMSVVRRIVTPKGGPKAVGPYSPGVIVDRTMYISGQIGLDPDTKKLVGDDLESQSVQAMKNLGSVLQGAELTYNNVVKTTVLLQDIKDWPAFNSIYEKYFPAHPPARAAYQVSALPMGAKVEIEAIAVVGDIVDAEAKM